VKFALPHYTASRRREITTEFTEHTEQSIYRANIAP